MTNRAIRLLAAALVAGFAAAVMQKAPITAAAQAERKDIFKLLAADGAEAIPVPGPVRGTNLPDEDCPVSFNLREELPVIRVVPADEIREDRRLVAWWESDQLHKIAAEGTWEARKRYEGDALRALVERHPYLGAQWYFSSPSVLNSSVRLVGVTAFVLSINKEVQVYLEFEPSDPKVVSTEGVLSTSPLPGLVDFPIKWDRDPEHLALLSRVLSVQLSGSPVNTLNRFGSHVLHVQWEIVDRNPTRAGFLFERGGRLYWAAGAPDYYRTAKIDGYREHNQRYRWAYDFNDDGLPELQFRVEGRYSSHDTFFSITADGMRRCAIRIISSD